MNDLIKRWAIVTGLIWAWVLIAIVNGGVDLAVIVWAIAAPFVAMPIAHFSDW